MVVGISTFGTAKESAKIIWKKSTKALDLKKLKKKKLDEHWMG